MQGSCAWGKGRIDCKASVHHHPFRGEYNTTQPQQCTLKRKSLKITMNLHTIWSPQKIGYLIIHDILLFLFPVLFSMVQDDLAQVPNNRAIFPLYKNCRRVDPSTKHKENHCSLLETFHPPPPKKKKQKQCPNLKGSSGWWFPMKFFLMVHPQRLSWGDWKLTLPLCVIHVTQIARSHLQLKIYATCYIHSFIWHIYI